jgi:DNA helicase-2/ATP-dependent DNA helicase PcrA
MRQPAAHYGRLAARVRDRSFLRGFDMTDHILLGLNAEQTQAVCQGDGPLLIIAGAGTGKTKTLVHRVARLIETGQDPSRILLLTFSRRAAAEMLRRVEELFQRLNRQQAAVHSKGPKYSQQIWGGTFHAIASRLLRQYGRSIGLDADFTIHDRSDSEDLLDVVRSELGLAKTDRRFPKKGTCMSIYSHCVNSQTPIQDVLSKSFPWCADYEKELKSLFQAYVDRKESGHVLDYDDLLLFWHGMLSDPQTARPLQARFDCVLVDEYQDTNRLQSEIIRLLRPGGRGITAVGDDAQSIYSFRAATVRNILDFPQEFPGTTLVKLEQNYRSTQPILAATNALIEQAKERYTKNLWSERVAGARPQLITCLDETEQADLLVAEVLARREAGLHLHDQAVLFRASHHSILLEAELARHNIPFVKYGGLKFVEMAHVKDLLAFLRLAENPRDLVAGTRILKMLPGVGPKKAQQLMDQLLAAGGDFRAWSHAKLPADARWGEFVALLVGLAQSGSQELPVQLHRVRKFYAPLLEQQHDHAEPRMRDLEQLEQLASRFTNRSTLLTELTLDPPASTQDFAGTPSLDEDYLVLSTIHSAKGLEWDSVYVIHAVDGNIPSDLATGNAQQIDEELRLFYVALTRAKQALQVYSPLRYYHSYGGRSGDRHSYAQLTRFLTADVKNHFDCRAVIATRDDAVDSSAAGSAHKDIRRRIRAMWS